MSYRIEHHNLDGRGERRCRVYPVPATAAAPQGYWEAVTDVPCPSCPSGTVRWAEAGYVPGYRICDTCGRHFLAAGDHTAPALIRVGARRSRNRVGACGDIGYACTDDGQGQVFVKVWTERARRLFLHADQRSQVPGPLPPADL